MATILHRGTPASSLNPQTSQVTAAVLEFRCMFTHDVLKKKKKWHDGSLRFHTFNKRVMVYDESKNLVGDLHYRQPEDFGEGLELKLDRPVLVQVEEPLGQTNTDLTPLLTRQKQDGTTHCTPSTQLNRAALPRINAANSQIKSKSIKELLDASQGRLGRARLPERSPFEQRQTWSDIQPTIEPPTKKRKVDLGKENRHAIIGRSATQLHASKTAAIRSVPVQALSSETVVELSSDDDSGPTIHPIEPQPMTREWESSVQDLPSRKDGTKAKHKQVAQVRNQKDSDRRESDEYKSSTSRPLPDTSRKSQFSTVLGPRSSLKFALETPRPKLMYKALLGGTSTSLQQNNFRSRHASNLRSQTISPTSTYVLHETRAEDATASINHLLEGSLQGIDAEEDNANVSQCSSLTQQECFNNVNRSAEKQSTSRNGSVEPAIHHANNELEIVVASPLFVPRTASQMSLEQTQDLLTNRDDFRIPSSCKSQETESQDRTAEAIPAEHAVEKKREEYPTRDAALEKSSSPFPRLTQPNFAYVSPEPSQKLFDLFEEPLRCDDLLEEPAITRPLQACSAILEASRPFRRVRSETCVTKLPEANEVFGEEREAPEGPFNVSDRCVSNIDLLDNLSRSPRHPRARLKTAVSDPISLNKSTVVAAETLSSPRDDVLQHMLPAELQQSRSCSGASETRNESPMHELQPSAVVDSGPWTSVEAFLLFDWWPPEKQKPDYGQATLMNGASKRDLTSANAARYSDRHANQSISTNTMSKLKYGTFGSARLVSQR